MDKANLRGEPYRLVKAGQEAVGLGSHRPFWQRVWQHSEHDGQG